MWVARVGRGGARSGGQYTAANNTATATATTSASSRYVEMINSVDTVHQANGENERGGTGSVRRGRGGRRREKE